jgi:hypothetical protein
MQCDSLIGCGFAFRCRMCEWRGAAGHNADESGERDVALSDSDATNAMERARHSTRMREVAGYIRVSSP